MLFRSAKKSGAITSEELTAKRTAYKKAIRKGQNDNYKDFIDTIADPNQISKMLKAKARAHQPIGLLNKGGVTVSSGHETVDLLLDTHFPGSVKGSGRTNTYRKVDLSHPNVASRVAFITKDKVIEAFNSFGEGKAAGEIGRAHV